jgi:RNA polymerase sigma-70 factor, ECF subfamily
VLEQPLSLGSSVSVPTMARVDEVRLRRIVEANFDALWRFLRQEVILVLARKLELVERDREKSFVFSTAFRIASDMRRRAKRRRQIEAAPLYGPSDFGPDPEASAEQKRLTILFARVLEQLSLELRVVFVLYELEEFTMAEIAETLRLPPGTVASRLRRGRDMFERLAAGILAEGEEP